MWRSDKLHDGCFFDALHQNMFSSPSISLFLALSLFLSLPVSLFTFCRIPLVFAGIRSHHYECMLPPSVATCYLPPAAWLAASMLHFQTQLIPLQLQRKFSPQSFVAANLLLAFAALCMRCNNATRAAIVCHRVAGFWRSLH